MEIFRHHGQSLAYLNKGSGSPVLFLHNAGTSHVIWQQQIEELSTRHQVIAVDLPGYGQSPPLAGDFSIGACIDLIAAFLEAMCDTRPVTLVGNCLGSAIALAYAARYPAKVAALVLLNPLTPATFRQGNLGGLSALKARFPALANALAQRVSRFNPQFLPVTGAILMQSGKAGWKSRLWRQPGLRGCYDNPHTMTALTGLFLALPELAEFDDFVPDADFPPLYTLWGRQNRILSSRAGDILNARLRPRQALFMEDCGHLLMMERPQVVCDVVRAACAARD